MPRLRRKTDKMRNKLLLIHIAEESEAVRRCAHLFWHELGAATCPSDRLDWLIDDSTALRGNEGNRRRDGMERLFSCCSNTVLVCVCLCSVGAISFDYSTYQYRVSFTPLPLNIFFVFFLFKKKLFSFFSSVDCPCVTHRHITGSAHGIDLADSLAGFLALWSPEKRKAPTKKERTTMPSGTLNKLQQM